MGARMEFLPERIKNYYKKKLIPKEHQECKAFWDYCQVVLKLGLSVIHIPNEGKRSFQYGKTLKKIGLTKGALDYIFFIPNKRWHGLLIDIKTIDKKGKKPSSKEQQAFIENALKQGYYASYAYGCDEAIRIYKDYINDKI